MFEWTPEKTVDDVRDDLKRANRLIRWTMGCMVFGFVWSALEGSLMVQALHRAFRDASWADLALAHVDGFFCWLMWKTYQDERRHLDSLRRLRLAMVTFIETSDE